MHNSKLTQLAADCGMTIAQFTAAYPFVAAQLKG